jgi:alpha-tubulin suppressor-like RCC1 family protein
MVVTEGGEVYGWGKNEHNQIGPSNNHTISIPEKMAMKEVKISAIAAGWAHSLLLSTGGEIYSFGFGEDGQLGHGSHRSLSEPTLLEC